MAIHHIACLGSSFAAGPGIAPIASAPAGRSQANFAQTTADILAARSGAGAARPRVTDLSVSGATLSNVLEERQTPLRGGGGGRRSGGSSSSSSSSSSSGASEKQPGDLGADGLFPPQITGLPPDADVVLLTAGGNDVGYLASAMQEVLRAGSWLGWFLGLILGWLAPHPALHPTDEDGVVARLAAVVDAIHARAPGANVLLVEYLALFPHPGDDDDDRHSSSSARQQEKDTAELATQRAMAATGLRRKQIARHAAVAHMLSRAYKRVASDAQRQAWCSVVAVDAASRTHHALGSDAPWVDGLSLAELFQKGASGRIPLHPNKQGMDAVAHLVVAHLDSLDRRLQPPPQPQPQQG